MQRQTIVTLVLALIVAHAPAQSPAPVVAQPAATITPRPAMPAPATSAALSDAPYNALLQVKAANEEILRKQAETLRQLSEIEKAADQIKIFSKRS